MANKATTIEEKDYKGFTFQNITFNTKNGISGIITLNGFDYIIENNSIKGDDVVSLKSYQSSAQSSDQNIIPVNDTKATDIKNALFNQLQGTGITMKIV